MGLSDYKKWRRKKEFLEFLSEYGITEEILKSIPSLSKSKPSFTEKKKEEKKEVVTPQQLVEAFAGDVEEFYPNGKGNR